MMLRILLFAAVLLAGCAGDARPSTATPTGEKYVPPPRSSAPPKTPSVSP